MSKNVLRFVSFACAGRCFSGCLCAADAGSRTGSEAVEITPTARNAALRNPRQWRPWM